MPSLMTHLMVCYESPLNLSAGSLSVQLLKWFHYQPVPRMIHSFAILVQACREELSGKLSILNPIRGVKCIKYKRTAETLIRMSGWLKCIMFICYVFFLSCQINRFWTNIHTILFCVFCSELSAGCDVNWLKDGDK